MHSSVTPRAKDAFQLPEGLHYLNCAYQAPLPRAVEAAGLRGMRAKRDPSGIGPDAFFDDADRLRRAFARLLGAGAPDGAGTEGGERVAILPSVSYGIATAARNAGLRPGQEVLLLRDQFPGNVYGWMRAADEAGASVRFVDPPTPAPAPGRGAGWNARLLEAIGPRTRVVSLGHVHWTDGTLFDLAAVGARCRDVGALLVVDGTQSVGALALPLAEARPDAVIVAGYKWLLGPYSTALGWFGPAFDGGIPLEESWIAREGSRDFARLVEYQDGYEPGAVRFDVGERSNFILLPMLLAALELLESWGGPARVAEHNRALLAPFLEWAREAGFGVDDAGAQGAHMVGVALPRGLDPGAAARALAARRIAVSVRGPALRISPHLYNDSDDVAALMGALVDAPA